MNHEEKQQKQKKNIVRKIISGDDPHPLIVEIQPCDTCSHRCQYCFHSERKNTAKKMKETLPLEKYFLLFSEMNSLNIRELSISGGGEPTLDERLPQIIKNALQQQLSVRLVTNGNKISEELLHQLVLCDEVRFSIDAAKPETYSEIRQVPGECFQDTLRNIEQLLRLRSEKKDSHLIVGATFLIKEQNQNEIWDFLEIMKKIGVDRIIIKYDIYDKKATSQESISQIKIRSASIKNTLIEFRDRIDILPNKKPCFMPYFKISLNPYGELFSCCLAAQPNSKEGYKFGNLHTDRFGEIWKKSKKIRQKMNKLVLCNHCNYNDFLINQEVLHDIKNRS